MRKTYRQNPSNKSSEPGEAEVNKSAKGERETKEGKVGMFDSVKKTFEIIVALLVIFFIIIGVLYLGINGLKLSEYLKDGKSATEEKIANKGNSANEEGKEKTTAEDNLKKEITAQVKEQLDSLLGSGKVQSKNSDAGNKNSNGNCEIKHIVLSDARERISVFCSFTETDGKKSFFEIILSLDSELKRYKGEIPSLSSLGESVGSSIYFFPSEL